MLLSLISPQSVVSFADNFEKTINWIKNETESVELIIVEDNSSDSSLSKSKLCSQIIKML